jgi:PAS domain S-box-containing protein
LTILIALLAVPSISLIIYSGIAERHQAIAGAKTECLKFVNDIAGQQQALAAGAEQLATALSLLPPIQSRNPAAAAALFSDLLKKNPQYANIVVCDKSGVVWTSAIPFEGKVSLADRRFFQEAARTGMFSSGEYTIGRIMKKPMISFGYPVKNTAHELIAVIGIVLDFDYSQHVFEKLNFPPGSLLALLDRQGIILIRNVNDSAENLSGRRDPQRELFTRMTEGPDEGTWEAMGNDGRFRLRAYKRISLPHESKPYLYIRSGIPLASATSKANAALFRNLSAFVSLFFIGLFLAWLIGNRLIVDPAMMLKGASERLAAGADTVHVSSVVKGGELGEVARAFDGMAAALVQRETTLRESEHRWAATLASIGDGVIATDIEGKTTFMNAVAEELTGWTLGEASMKPVTEVFHIINEHTRSEAESPVAKVLRQGMIIELANHTLLVRQDGTEVPIDNSGAPIRDAEGKTMGVVLVFRDITDRKRAEKKLTETNRRLEEATTRANEMALQADMANAAKSEFLANMSHEIRTPMNGVIGMTGLLLDTDLNEDQRSYAETVRKSGESLLGLINDILDFSKIEAGRLDMKTLDFDLRALLDDFAATAALRAHEKGLEFICAAAPDVPAYLRGDPGRLRQILTNLTGNAVKFTHEGEIAVRASLVSETDSEAVIRFSVKDTGIGVPAHKQELLFQKFIQVDASNTRKYGGTGLGLAISKQLVEMMNGEIGVKSEEGRGSEFWFAVRLAKQPAQERAEMPLADIRGIHILVADDNATNREVLTAQLRSWGVRTEDAQDGFAALKALYLAKDAVDPFRIAILDMQMPGMDGVALARVIKADEALKSTHLVLLSSLGQRGDARQMEEVGFSAYLTKPVRQSELFDCLSVVLAGTAATRQAQPIVTRHSIREMRRGAVRILLAEDNITSQQVAIMILKKLGLYGDAVANGAEAVHALEILPYDLVLMDVQMPEMDGLEATQHIRDPQSMVRNHQVPIIAMTAHAMQGDREKYLKAGMNDYVSKPVSLKALGEVLEKWLPEEATATTKQAVGKPEVRVPATTK